MTQRYGSGIWRAIPLTLLAWCNPTDAQSTQPRLFSVSGAPTLEIEDDGSAARQFTNVLTRRLPGGDIVVGDPDGRYIRVFDRTGRPRPALARPGNGPGELPGAFRMSTSGDTVFAFGQPPSSVSGVGAYLSPRGFLRTMPISTAAGASVVVVDRLLGGQLLVRRGSGGRVLNRAPDLGTLVPDTAVFGILSRADDSNAVLWLAPVVGQWNYPHRWPRGPLATTISPYPFRAATFVLTSADLVWIVDGGTGDARAVNGSGRQVLAVRLSGEKKSFDRSMTSARQRKMLVSAKRAMDSARAEAVTDTRLLPASMPLVDAAVAGADGEVWLRRYSIDEDTPRMFVVLDRRGSLLGEVRAPSGFELQHAGRDFLLGIRRSEDGLVTIVEYRLSRR